MKKIINLSIVASLAMAGAAMAQQPSPDESQAPTKKEAPGKHQRPEKPQAEKPQAEKPQVEKPAAPHTPKADTSAVKEPGANQAPVTAPPTTKPDKNARKNQKNTPATAPSTNADQSTATTPGATPDVTKNQSRRNNKNSKAPANLHNSIRPSPAAPRTAATASPAAPKTAATASPAAAKTTTTPAPTAATTPAPTTAATTPAAGATSTPATTTSASAAPSVAAQTNAVNPAAVKKPDPAKVQQIRQQHASFSAQPRPDRVPPVTFNQGYRIQNSDQWQGPQYEIYRSYHPERHDRGWYSSHYQRVELIAGGYYYFNNGYWYPAWGYDPGHEYYAYDAPIYVGKRSDPPDKVIADVQAALQEMGYYRGEVDGLIGPLTREALTKYQADNGMTVTAVIDEPTLDSLGMG